MTVVDSTAKPARSKPPKPGPDFPHFPHAAGYWAKKNRGKMHYFGPRVDPDAALRNFYALRHTFSHGSRCGERSAGGGPPMYIFYGKRDATQGFGPPRTNFRRAAEAGGASNG
jgi:hypothetical protein